MEPIHRALILEAQRAKHDLVNEREKYTKARAAMETEREELMNMISNWSQIISKLEQQKAEDDQRAAKTQQLLKDVQGQNEDLNREKEAMIQRQKEMENERNGDVESAQTLLKSKCSKVLCF